MIREINNHILLTAPKHVVSDNAPSSMSELVNQSGLIVWAGASEHTIFSDKRVNWAFRALHDALHLKTRIGFSPADEIELGRIQANQYSGLMADLIYIEVAKQAEYFLQNHCFILDQVEFTIRHLKLLGYSFNKRGLIL